MEHRCWRGEGRWRRSHERGFLRNTQALHTFEAKDESESESEREGHTHRKREREKERERVPLVGKYRLSMRIGCDAVSGDVPRCSSTKATSLELELAVCPWILSCFQTAACFTFHPGRKSYAPHQRNKRLLLCFLGSFGEDYFVPRLSLPNLTGAVYNTAVVVQGRWPDTAGFANSGIYLPY